MESKPGFLSVKIAIHNEILVVTAGENPSVKIEGGGGKGLYLYIVKIENFHPVLTSSLKHTRVE